MKKIVKIVLCMFTMCMLISCSHQLTLKNATQYSESTVYVDKSITIGVSPNALEEDLLNIVVDELYNLPNCKVRYPYQKNLRQPVDYIVDINITVKYLGSGTNFIISWPGFLIFAPVWNGFIYHADIWTNIKIRDFKSGDVLMSEKYNTNYRCNQSELDRTFIEISYVEYGVIALIGGILNMSYDKDITPDFKQALSRPYGQYIARKIGKHLQNI